jgi:hypothetical protein
MIDFGRKRDEGISDTIAYTTGPTEKPAVAESRITITPAAQDSAFDGWLGIPMQPGDTLPSSAPLRMQ